MEMYVNIKAVIKDTFSEDLICYTCSGCEGYAAGISIYENAKTRQNS